MGPWPAELADLADNEVIERARHLRTSSGACPASTPATAGSSRSGAVVCRELNRRGMCDVVTEGSAPGSVIFGQFGAE